jgi:hypothetical protein
VVYVITNASTAIQSISAKTPTDTLSPPKRKELYIHTRLPVSPSSHVKRGNEVIIPLLVFAIDAPSAGVRGAIIAVRSAHLQQSTRRISYRCVEESDTESLSQSLSERERGVSVTVSVTERKVLITHGVEKVSHFPLRVEVHVRPLARRHGDRGASSEGDAGAKRRGW